MRIFAGIRKSIILFAAFAMLALALMALPTPDASAQTDGQGKIEGQLVNGTKDARISANIPITLYYAAMGASGAMSTTTQADANGRFTFTNLDAITTTRYLAQANYTGVDYFSDLFRFDANQTTIPISMTVYETTTVPAVIKVNQTHLIFTVHTRAFEVQQIVAVENTSDRMYIGEALGGPHRATLTLPILADATNLTFDDPSVDSTTLRGDAVLTYTLPIGPGKDNIIYSYAVPFDPPTYEFSLELPYDTAKFGIFMPDVGAAIQSPQLSASFPMSGVVGTPNFVGGTAEKVAAGTTIKATFSNLPAVVNEPTASTETNAPADNSQLVGGIVLGIAMLAAIGLIAYPILRQRATRPASLAAANRRMELLQAIADLDDDFEAGEIPEADYTEQRAALKAKLLELGE
jgi:hypothetical protein